MVQFMGRVSAESELAVKTVDKTDTIVPSKTEEVMGQPLTQAAAAEVVPPVLQPSPHLDPNFRSAPPVATARCATPGSPRPPLPPQPNKKHSYMDKEKQRWTSLFGS